MSETTQPAPSELDQFKTVMPNGEIKIDWEGVEAWDQKNRRQLGGDSLAGAGRT